MLGYTSRRNRFGSLTGNSSASNLTVGDDLMNDNDKIIIAKRPWTWRKKTRDFTTTANQSSLTLPQQVEKVNSIFLLSGSTRYPVKEISSRKKWIELTQTPSDSAVYPDYFYVRGNVVEFYPQISTASNTLTVEFVARQKDLSVADYTTGTITAIANGATTVTGSSTVWTDQMVGRMFRITDGTGDGEWYEIASVTSNTELELASAYQGTTLAAASANYTIIQTSLVPEEYQAISLYWAVSDYFMSGQNPKMERADRWKRKGDELYQDMLRNYSSATMDNAIEDNDIIEYINSNNFPQSIG